MFPLLTLNNQMAAEYCLTHLRPMFSSYRNQCLIYIANQLCVMTMCNVTICKVYYV